MYIHTYIHPSITFTDDQMDCGTLTICSLHQRTEEFVSMTFTERSGCRGQELMELWNHRGTFVHHILSSLSLYPFLVPLLPLVSLEEWNLAYLALKNQTKTKKPYIFSWYVGVLLISWISAYLFSYNQASRSNSLHSLPLIFTPFHPQLSVIWFLIP